MLSQLRDTFSKRPTITSNQIGATPEEIDAMSKEALSAYIARSVINASVGYMYIPEDVTTVVGVAWEAVKQLMAQFLP